MKKWMLLLSPLLMNISIDGWGGRFNTTPSANQYGTPSLETYFPYNADQGWFVEESYLLMKPNLDDLNYGDMISAKGSPTDTTFKIKVKKPEFDWNSGVRIGIGKYLPHHDAWDVSLYTTYFYGDAEDRARGNLAQSKGLAASYTPFMNVISEKTTAVWRLNYFVWDLMLGRLFSMTPQIIFHPYIGLRAALIYTDFKSKNAGDISVSSEGVITTDPGRAKVTMNENFWGIGPRIGSNFDYKFVNQWSFLGNLAGSLLYGHFHVKEKSVSTLFMQNTSQSFTSKSFDHDNTIRINLEAAIGMGWERWFQNNTIRLAPTLLFESSLWFDMNDFFTPITSLSQDRGDLGLMGLSFNLQVDF